MEIDIDGEPVDDDGNLILPENVTTGSVGLTYEFEAGKLYTWLILREPDEKYPEREIFALTVNLTELTGDVITFRPLETAVGRPYSADYAAMLFVQNGRIPIENPVLSTAFPIAGVELSENFNVGDVTLTLVDAYDFSLSNNYDFEKYIPSAPDEDLTFIVERYGLSLEGIPNDSEAVRAAILTQLRDLIREALVEEVEETDEPFGGEEQ